MFVYVLNAAVDNVVLFYELLSFENRPYVTSLVLSLPVVLFGIALMGMVFKNGVDHEQP